MKINMRAVLTVVSIFGVGATAFCSARDTKKAEESLNQAACKVIDYENGTAKKIDRSELSKKEVMKIKTKSYIPTAVVGVTTAVCIAYSHKISSEAILAAAGSGALVSKNFKQFKDKAVEIYGQDAVDDIERAIAKDKECGIEHAEPPQITYCSNPFTCDSTDPDEEITLFYDMFKDRWFRSNLFSVLAAEYHMNRNFALGMTDISIKDFYEFLGLPSEPGDDRLGWDSETVWENSYCWLDFNHIKSTTPAETGEDYYILSYGLEPTEMW